MSSPVPAPRPSPAACAAIRAFLMWPDWDRVSWADAADAVAYSPHPMPKATLRRKFLEAGGREYTDRKTGAVTVSRSAVLRFHRDLWSGWSSVKPPRPYKRRRKRQD